MLWHWCQWYWCYVVTYCRFDKLQVSKYPAELLTLENYVYSPDLTVPVLLVRSVT